MCGICGFINLNIQSDNLSNLKLMTSSLNHRGPDDENLYFSREHNVYLGHKRLSILDLSEKGRQPMISSNGQYILVYNGEVYNHLELRKKYFKSSKIWKSTSDTETILECIQEIGLENTLVDMTGMFAFHLYDFQNKFSYLVRDRFGEKPCYYSHEKKNLSFSSELKALKLLPFVEKKIDQTSIFHQLNFSYIPCDKSILSSVKNVTPGSYLKFKVTDNEIKFIHKKLYWNGLNQIKSSMQSKYTNTEVAEEEIESQLNTTIKGQLLSDVEIGTFFSGGIDSTLVTLETKKINNSFLKSFTIGFDDENYDEANFANKIANQIGLNICTKYITKDDIINIIPKLNDIYDEPFSDSSQIPTYFLSKLTNTNNIKVVLTGDGGDEIFGGYNRYFLIKKLRFLNYFPYHIRKGVFSILAKIPSNMWSLIFKIFENLHLSNNKIPNLTLKITKFLQICSYRNYNEVFEIILRTLDLTKILKDNHKNLNITVNKFDSFSFKKLEEFMMYFDTLNYLPGDILTKVDRATMNNSIEARAPFLDHNLFKKAWKLPTNLKLGKSSGKIILKNILSKHISRDLFQRPKMGFAVPLDSVLKTTKMRDWCMSNLDPNFLKQYEYFDLDKINKLKYDYFNKNIGSYTSIWNIIILSDWLRKNG